MAIRFIIARGLFVVLFVLASLAKWVFDHTALWWWGFTITIVSYLGLKIVYNASRLLWLMKRYHYLEYQTHKRSIFSVAFLSTILLVYKTSSLIYNKEFFADSEKAELKLNAKDYAESCDDPEYNLSFRHILDFMFHCAKLAETLLAMVIILLKQPKDVLQGINKLDYFLKISFFQVYKDKAL